MIAMWEPFGPVDFDEIEKIAADKAVASTGRRRSPYEERRVNELAGVLAHYFAYPHRSVKSPCGLPPPFPRVSDEFYAQRCAVCVDRYYGSRQRGMPVPLAPEGRWLLVPIRASASGGDVREADL